MNENHHFHPESFADLFAFSDEVEQFIADSLEDFNTRRIKLFDLPAYQRIFLFILTRSIKTYSSILVLCRSGYGQDVATLMRSLLENLITARYIIQDEQSADMLAKRFVAYKWIIFKRQLPEQELAARHSSEEDRNAFLERKNLVLGKVLEFKETFGITSDRALITWSGKSVRDMARKVSRELLNEYEKTFRLCSRFSHPSILGDNEYMIQNGNKLTFSPQPSHIGIESNLLSAALYALNFMEVTDRLFGLDRSGDIKKLQNRTAQRIRKSTIHAESTEDKRNASPPSIRDSFVAFQMKNKGSA